MGNPNRASFCIKSRPCLPRELHIKRTSFFEIVYQEFPGGLVVKELVVVTAVVQV